MGLITDFGLADSYVSELKLSILRYSSRVRFIDISHETPSGDILSGSHLLKRSCKYFPAGSIITAVVDPGVGSDRQAVAVRNNKLMFVGPDNGIFAGAIDWESEIDIRILDESDAMENGAISSTFHGRDLFGPVAGMLANGKDFDEIGKMGAFKATFAPDPPKIKKNSIAGRVVYIDKFGNIATNIPTEIISVNSKVIIDRFDHCLSFRKTYSKDTDDELFWLFGSDGCLEIAANRRNAAEILNSRIGDGVEAFNDMAIDRFHQT